jgi:aspartyl/asparaginyl beta-hydroxylase (cupin superfamily)
VIVFDDSKIHYAFNTTDAERLVLIVDIKRPDHIPMGTAKGGHTSELDDFISRFA